MELIGGHFIINIKEMRDAKEEIWETVKLNGGMSDIKIACYYAIYVS